MLPADFLFDGNSAGKKASSSLTLTTTHRRSPPFTVALLLRLHLRPSLSNPSRPHSLFAPNLEGFLSPKIEGLSPFVSPPNRRRLAILPLPVGNHNNPPLSYCHTLTFSILQNPSPHPLSLHHLTFVTASHPSGPELRVRRRSSGISLIRRVPVFFGSASSSSASRSCIAILA
ncbi:hypothetical protein PIB30_030253 [Stylosanthes scabra]|uniref:Uncharacterized protein n=1 Tax=Stylosanthes scabra TaxID=79078 RepID=A0ABU6XD85_9FABA|nr:hypothetical protein [Stylosanthes scabra]